MDEKPFHVNIVLEELIALKLLNFTLSPMKLTTYVHHHAHKIMVACYICLTYDRTNSALIPLRPRL